MKPLINLKDVRKIDAFSFGLGLIRIQDIPRCSYAASVQEHWRAVLALPVKNGLHAGILLRLGVLS